jgi:hypothetical protein
MTNMTPMTLMTYMTTFFNKFAKINDYNLRPAAFIFAKIFSL